MPTGDWTPSEAVFLEFIGAQHVRDAPTSGRSALFLDPDTGIGARLSSKHTTVERIVTHLERHALVFAFDQSLSRGTQAVPQLREKLRRLRQHGAHGFYYDSHARFLFSSRSHRDLRELQETLLKIGLPGRRILTSDT